MKFIKHIFSGILLVFTLVFNAGFFTFAYQLAYGDLLQEENIPLGIIIALFLYGMYWAYCVETFKTK